jgi:hypothetical protein
VQEQTFVFRIGGEVRFGEKSTGSGESGGQNILPPLLATAVFLAPLAAIGLIIVQAVAIGVHMKMGDLKSLPINISLLLLAFVAAWIGVLTFPLS